MLKDIRIREWTITDKGGSIKERWGIEVMYDNKNKWEPLIVKFGKPVYWKTVEERVLNRYTSLKKRG